MIYRHNKICIRYFKINFKYKIIVRLLYVIDHIDYTIHYYSIHNIH